MHLYVDNLNISGSDNAQLPGHTEPLSEPVLEYC